jgi:hypothetical protein
MPATYRANVTDKEQGDVERANDDSADRFPWFDGKVESTGEMKAVPAYDLQAEGNTDGSGSSAVAQFTRAGMVIGQHNDKPALDLNPGKA